MHLHASWKMLSAFVFRSGLAQLYYEINTSYQLVPKRSTSETPRNVLHHMDRSQETLQLIDDCNSRTNEL